MTAQAPAKPSWEHPASLWMNGRLVPWEQCTVHLTSGYAQRGASVFEGVRLYKGSRPGTHFALGLAEHLERLNQTWQALSLRSSYSDAQVRAGLEELLASRELGDAYCRITRYLGLRTAEDPREPDGIFIAAYNVPQLLGKPVACITSSWRRDSLALPAQMKIGGHYFMLSWLKQQAQQKGADDAILLNSRDLVCEATGTAVCLYIGGKIVMPPTSDGALPSITARIVLRIASTLGIPTATRSVHRAELFQAAAVFLAGSLDELRPVASIDGVHLPDASAVGPVNDLFKRFALICRPAQEEQGWGEVFTA
jgi:branched-chain amino acid aminotransferase